MIDFQSARKLINEKVPLMGKNYLNLSESHTFILGEDISARENIPTFTSSAVDGYAFRFSDILPEQSSGIAKLQVKGILKAGDNPIGLKRGHAYKIFTGAPIPRGADTVVMVESTEEKEGEVYINKIPAKGENIRSEGEEFKKGDEILSEGREITPPVVGLLATLGYRRVKVYKKPRVSIIVTGDEIKSLTARLRRGEIRDSNSYSLRSALLMMGIEPVSVLRVRDEKKLIKDAFIKELKRSDTVVSAGGVSVGDYDFVREVLEELGFREIFNKVAMKPGKPNYFGVKGKKVIFGLPGNPVSAMLSFYLFVRPALYKMMGGHFDSQNIAITSYLNKDIRKKPGIVEFVRGLLSADSGSVSPASGQESHMMGGLATANCLICFPEESSELKKSSNVKVELLRW